MGEGSEGNSCVGRTDAPPLVPLAAAPPASELIALLERPERRALRSFLPPRLRLVADEL